MAGWNRVRICLPGVGLLEETARRRNHGSRDYESSIGGMGGSKTAVAILVKQKKNRAEARFFGYCTDAVVFFLRLSLQTEEAIA